MPSSKALRSLIVTQNNHIEQYYAYMHHRYIPGSRRFLVDFNFESGWDLRSSLARFKVLTVLSASFESIIIEGNFCFEPVAILNEYII